MKRSVPGFFLLSEGVVTFFYAVVVLAWGVVVFSVAVVTLARTIVVVLPEIEHKERAAREA